MMSEEQRARAPQRIERLLLILGAVLGVALLVAFDWKSGVGALIGVSAAWLNFRWMRTSVSRLADKLMQTSDSRGSTALFTLKFLLRYAVLVALVYATLNSSVASVLGVFAGLLMIVPALMIEAGYEFYLSQQHDTQVF
jgi:uncharacterized membrane protein